MHGDTFPAGHPSTLQPACARPSPCAQAGAQAAIANAATLEEVARLESALRTGHLPSQVADAAAHAAKADAGGVAAMDEG